MNRIELVSNAGVLIELDGVRLLLDAFVGRSHPPYRTMPQEIFDRLMAEPAVDYLLYTHLHPDHCSPRQTAAYLSAKGSHVIAGEETAASLVRAGVAAERIHVAKAPQFTLAAMGESPVTVTAFPTRHLGPEYAETQHFSFLIEGTRRIVCAGDATPLFVNFTLEEQPIGKVDVLCATYPFVTGNPEMRIFKAGLLPKTIFVTHLPDRPFEEESYQRIEAAEKAGRPFAVFVPAAPGDALPL